MSFQKFILFFVSIFAVSALFARISTPELSLADEAKVKADRISGVENELKQLSSDAASSGDFNLKACVENYSGTVRGLVTSANGMTSQIVLLATTGKTMEARNQMSALNALTDSADQNLAKAKSCEKSNAVSQNSDADDSQEEPVDSVSDAMTLKIGKDMPAEADRSEVEGSDPADAATVEASDVQRSSNEAPDNLDPQDIERLIEEEEGAEVQSPTE